MTSQTISPLRAIRPSGIARLSHFGLSCLFSAATLLILLAMTSSAVATGSFVTIVARLAVLAGIQLVYTRLRPDPIISAVAGALLGLTWTGLVAGLIALTGLRLGAPLIDADLAHADAFLRVSTPAIVAWTAKYPWLGRGLDVVYVSSVPAVFVSAVLLAIRRSYPRMRELVLSFSACGAVCAAFAALCPAIGAFSYYGIAPDVAAGLPIRSGLFHLAIFNGYRSGALTAIDLRNLEGVVTFPSFHACMALMVAYALRSIRGVSAVAWLWSGAVLFSTIPIGGHYAVDVLAGTAVWSVFPLASLWHGRRQASVSGIPLNERLTAAAR